MKISKIILPILFIAIVSATSCGDDENSAVNCATLLASGETIFSNFTTTGFAYASDPSSTNCASYKAAIESYISYANEAKACFSGSDLTDLNESITEAQTAMDNLDC